MGSLIRLNVFLLAIASLVLAAHYGAKKGLSLLYLSIAGGCILILYLLYALSAFLSFRWRPPFPRCKTGKCPGVGYYHYIGVEKNSANYRCDCGIEYLLSNEGTLQILDKGRAAPFMYHTRFGRWKPAE
jgi:hypothetical protein